MTVKIPKSKCQIQNNLHTAGQIAAQTIEIRYMSRKCAKDTGSIVCFDILLLTA
jgi:hypothetical protein